MLDVKGRRSPQRRVLGQQGLEFKEVRAKRHRVVLMDGLKPVGCVVSHRPCADDGSACLVAVRWLILVLVVPECAPDHNLAVNWQASLNPGGSPGTSGILTLADWKATYGNPADNSDNDNDGWTVLEEFYLGGSPVTRDNLAPVFTYNLGTLTATATVTRRAGISAKLNLQSSLNLNNWATHSGANIISNQRPQTTPDVETLTYSIPLSLSKEFFRFTFSQ